MQLRMVPLQGFNDPRPTCGRMQGWLARSFAIRHTQDLTERAIGDIKRRLHLGRQWPAFRRDERVAGRAPDASSADTVGSLHRRSGGCRVRTPDTRAGPHAAMLRSEPLRF
jgi:hypothetical protein